VVDALVDSGARGLSPAVAPLLRDEGPLARARQLEFWDRNAPLARADTRKIAWDEAKNTVLEAYGRLLAEMADIADVSSTAGLDRRAGRPGKAPGAFAHPTVPSVHPYVLLNYLGKPRDVMTLAHELGHGVHQVLAAIRAR
jgi:oligoendopeptidase F